MRACYLDTSALVKLVVVESESDALRSWLAETPATLVTGDLARTELMRAVQRTAPDQAVQARAVLDALTIIECTTAIFEAAGRLSPPQLRSFDALHLATALDLGDDLESMLTYDDRLADAARHHGVTVIAPEP